MHISTTENACYYQVLGLAVSIAISIVIYMCNFGNGHVVNRALSWEAPGQVVMQRFSGSFYVLVQHLWDYIYMRSSLIY